jgi:hypothetical protein
MYFYNSSANRRYLLVHKDALAYKVLTESPHLVTTQILILKSELNEIR